MIIELKKILKTKIYEVLIAPEIPNKFKAEYLADFIEEIIDIKQEENKNE